jgi:hypothetical protein
LTALKHSSERSSWMPQRVNQINDNCFRLSMISFTLSIFYTILSLLW